MELEYKKISVSNRDTYVFSGAISQNAESLLSYLLQKVIDKECTFDLENVTSVDSYGVRAWIRFITALTKNTKVTFERCNVHIVQQMNMISEFTGGAEVVSVIGEYECTACDISHNEVFEKGRNLPEHSCDEAPRLQCSKCGATLEMACLEEEFFHWLDAG